jgi:cell division protein FtsB
METIAQKVAEALIAQGIIGIFCVILIGVIIWQARQNDKLAAANEKETAETREENKQLRAYIRDLQDKRVTEIQAIVASQTKVLSDFTIRANDLLSAFAATKVQR